MNFNFSNRLFKNETGFTLTEALITVAIVVIAISGLISTLVILQKSQANVVGRSDSDRFMQSVSKYLLSEQGCKRSLANLPIPTSAASPFVLNEFKGFGEKMESIASGRKITNYLSVNSLTIQKKGDKPTIAIKNNLPYTRTIAQITFKLQYAPGANSTPVTYDRYIEVPILERTNPNTGLIADCNVGIDLQDACTTAGGTFHPITKTCTPSVGCQFKGMRYGCWPYPSCISTSYPAAVMFNKTSGSGIAQPGICPADSVAAHTGTMASQYYGLPCGKGGCTPYYNTVFFYICLRCQ
jgi:type II secretory pathway pseudopilin PulG